MKSGSIFFNLLAWLQLIISILLATAIIWGYFSYQTSLGQFVHSVAASVNAVSTTVIRTAETVEANKELLDQTGQMLVTTRNLVSEFRITAENQVKNGPQYASSLNSASKVTGKLATTFESLGQKLFLLSLPTGIQMQGLKPLVVMSRIFEHEGNDLKSYATDLKTFSATLTALSNTIGQDGVNLGAALIAESEQAIKIITLTESALARIKMQDLPKAITELKATSENLRTISAQIDMVDSGGLILLIIGLLFAMWCIVQSLGVLLLSKSHASKNVKA